MGSVFLLRQMVFKGILENINVMRIVEINYHKPANSLIAALQKYCMTLMSAPEQHDIFSLKDLEDKIWKFAEEQHATSPKCKLDNLEVISDSNMVHEWYNLLYRGEKSMITISARPDAFESAFRDYDDQRKKQPKGYSIKVYTSHSLTR